MNYLPTGTMMKEWDQHTTEHLGIPSMVLMERAALAVTAVCEKEYLDGRVLIVCGAGNNGGDGFAIARLLYVKKIPVTVVFLGRSDSRSAETRQQMQILSNYGLSISNTIPKEEYSIIIDCIFGSGLSRDITGIYFEAIELLNRMTGRKLAVDLPSGISASSGKVLGTAFRADITVALAFRKLGTALYPGSIYAGTVLTADIGIEQPALSDDAALSDLVYTLDKEDTAKLLPKRTSDSHKGTYGKVLMIAGSSGMAGAAYLSAKASYTVGAGLVRVYTHEDNRAVVQQLLPEAQTMSYTTYDEPQLHALTDWADVIAIGPGLGQSETALAILQAVLDAEKRACVIDADALNLLAAHPELLHSLKDSKECFYLLSPHMKEMSRMIHCTVAELKGRPLEALREFIQTYDTACVLKDARTAVCTRQKPMYLNLTGNAAMSKGGSGDVLTGILAGLIAQKQDPWIAAVTGVHIHGMAGDAAQQKKGSYSVLAGDIIDHISEVMKELEDISRHMRKEGTENEKIHKSLC